MNFEDFILSHEGDDPARLALSRDRLSPEVEDWDLALSTLGCRRKLKAKVPQWYAVPSLRYPLRLSAEQCSSSATAFYKASLVGGCGRLADLTGGLGVDSWAFASKCGEVLFNERNTSLADAAKHNFGELGVTNITVRSRELLPGNLADVLDGFAPDVIYLDPARRASDGRKVFRLEDCEPDVTALLPELLDACPTLMLKLSPMADLSLVSGQLGNVKEVHVVASDGECKELLLIVEKGFDGPFKTVICENGASMSVSSEPECPAIPGEDFLFEPGKAMSKAGAFGLPCRYGLTSIGRHTHLYLGGVIPEELKPFGRCRRVLEILPLDKRSLRSLKERYPRADVSSHNIPISSEELALRLGVKPGGGIHIYGLHEDASGLNKLYVTGLL